MLLALLPLLAFRHLHFPKLDTKGDTLYYKIETSELSFSKTPIYDTYHPRLDSWSNGWWKANITVMPG